MEKKQQLYEGKAKKVFATDDQGLLIVSYKDDATAFNGQKKGTILGKGAINNRVTNHLMGMLESKGIPTHFVRQLSDTDALVKAVAIVPLEVIVRNIAAGSLSQRLGIPEGTVLRSTVLEYSYKNDDLNDPLVNDYHIAAMNLASKEELFQIADYAFRINQILSDYLVDLGIKLIDFKLEFGKPISSGERAQVAAGDGRPVILADEISPDTCRFWDANTGQKLDKDRFRRDLGGVEDAYAEVSRRLLGQ